MARPISANQKEPLAEACEITVRLSRRLYDALQKIPRGERGQFIRDAIDEKLKRS